MKKFLLKTCSIILLTITLASLCLMGGCASKGVILKLEEAYELGLISREELQQIANYNNRIEGSPYDVTEIKKSTQKGICKAYAKLLEKTWGWDVDLREVSVRRFYGKYGNAFVVDVYEHNRVLLTNGWRQEIDGIVFDYYLAYERLGIVVYVVA